MCVPKVFSDRRAAREGIFNPSARFFDIPPKKQGAR